MPIRPLGAPLRSTQQVRQEWEAALSALEARLASFEAALSHCDDRERPSIETAVSNTQAEIDELRERLTALDKALER